MKGNVLGLDPGRDKCGLAVMSDRQQVVYHQTVDSDKAISEIQLLVERYDVNLMVMGDGTTSKTWQQSVESSFPELQVVTVDETNSTLEAKVRYWQMYPPTGLQRLIPQSLLVPPRPVDDIVAILLIERYLLGNSD